MDEKFFDCKEQGTMNMKKSMEKLSRKIGPFKSFDLRLLATAIAIAAFEMISAIFTFLHYSENIIITDY
jgi:hypothetical protein